MKHSEIRREVVRVIEKLPKQFRERLQNVEIVVETRPAPDLLMAEGLEPRHETLYGLYQGIPLPDRSAFDIPLLPDKITIFSEPLLADFPDPGELREQIRLTVLHEIAHFFGMEEDEIEELGY